MINFCSSTTQLLIPIFIHLTFYLRTAHNIKNNYHKWLGLFCIILSVIISSKSLSFKWKVLYRMISGNLLHQVTWWRRLQLVEVLYRIPSYLVHFYVTKIRLKIEVASTCGRIVIEYYKNGPKYSFKQNEVVCEILHDILQYNLFQSNTLWLRWYWQSKNGVHIYRYFKFYTHCGLIRVPF